jgi:prepilin-type N-terminal cleavage/methylation domain-containing protein
MKQIRNKRFHHAFTLVELLVVIAIIGLLSTIAVVSLGSARVKARNTQRKANLVQVSKALELYYSANGSYPSTGGIANWRGNCSSYTGLPDVDPADYPTNASWIPGLTAGGYMSRLPHDPNTGIANSGSQLTNCRNIPGYNCYLYTSTGTDYKLIAHCMPEGSWGTDDVFYDLARSNWAWQVTNNISVTSGW